MIGWTQTRVSEARNEIFARVYEAANNQLHHSLHWLNALMKVNSQMCVCLLPFLVTHGDGGEGLDEDLMMRCSEVRIRRVQVQTRVKSTSLLERRTKLTE